MLCRRNIRSGEKRRRCVGKTKRGRGNELMAVADGHGLPLAICAESASPAEVRLVSRTREQRFVAEVPERLIGGKAYDSDPFDRKVRNGFGVEVIALHRQGRGPERKTQDGRALRRFKRLWKVERLFAWLYNFRRLVVRYEYHIDNYVGLGLTCLRNNPAQAFMRWLLVMFTSNLILRSVALLALALSCTLPITGCKTEIWDSSFPRAFDKSKLMDSWIGYDNESGACYKLILAPQGSGVLYWRYLNGTYATNSIASWEVHEGSLYCRFSTVSAPTDPLVLRCTIRNDFLKGVLRGVGDWSEDIEFRRTQFVKENLAAFESLHP